MTEVAIRLDAASRSASREERLAALRADGFIDGVRGLLGERPPASFIGGRWVPTADGEVRASHDPSTGEVLGRFGVAGAGDVDAAVQDAAAAQPGWAALTLAQRIAHIERLAELIDQNGELLATADALDAGLPVARMLNDVDGMLRALRGWPGLAQSLRGDVMQGVPGLHYTRYQPFGVVARIVAYNHPIMFAVKGSVAPLLAGNTLVLKPADQTPMSALILGELLREALPPGVMNVVTGGAECGAALVSHPTIRRIAFTGSVATGRIIQEAAAGDQVRNVSLELGGKNPMIVFPDVDVQAAAKNAVFGMNLLANQGQSCGSTSRLFVHRDIYAAFEEALSAELASLTLGPATDVDVDMGPMISEAIADRVRGFIRSGVEDGARLVTGGLEDDRLPEAGSFVAPTLFSEVPPTARIAKEEIFGPVISMLTWDDRDAVIEAANAVEYGLTASIWTNDLNAALDTADRLEAGYVWINESTTHYFGMPFGGWKDSGVGREESIDEFRSYLQLKSVHVKLR